MIALCVDDEPLMLRSLVRKVKMSPDVKHAEGYTDAEEALKWADTHSFDIAFLDIQLRGIEGIALAKRLRERKPRLPIIFAQDIKITRWTP